MTLLTLEGWEIWLDRGGYLATLDDWSEPATGTLAAREELALTAEYWEILQPLRESYVKFQLPLANRPLIKYAAQRLGPDKGNSLHLNHLFKGVPAKLGVKLANLPKPSNRLRLSRLPLNIRSPSSSAFSAKVSAERTA